MTEVPIGTFFASLVMLRRLGVEFGSIIDVGAADGSFVVSVIGEGMLPRGTRFLNIDPNPLYEPSLRRIAEAWGGSYRLAAASDAAGEITLTMGAHPYWTSPRAADDPYWETVNRMSAQAVRVPALTIDAMVAEARLPPPYLLKLDIQGHEAAALRGACEVLRQSRAVIVEADMADFAGIQRVIDDAGLVIFDLTELNRRADHTLKGCYPVYVNREVDKLLPRAHWARSEDANMLEKMQKRRGFLLSYIDEKLRGTG